MCEPCHGSGVVATEPPRVCPVCLGRGAPSPAARAHAKRDRFHRERSKARRYR